VRDSLESFVLEDKKVSVIRRTAVGEPATLPIPPNEAYVIIQNGDDVIDTNDPTTKPKERHYLLNDLTGGKVEVDLSDPLSILNVVNGIIGAPPAPPDTLIGSSLVPTTVAGPGGSVLTLPGFVTDPSVVAQAGNDVAVYNAQLTAYAARVARWTATANTLLGLIGVKTPPVSPAKPDAPKQPAEKTPDAAAKPPAKTKKPAAKPPAKTKKPVAKKAASSTTPAPVRKKK
jgi:hypothetical protein